ncbi:hypothetical protein ACIRF8_15145 [Streptomyces sp. NPDC102406]|uniref:hypothetical protein n=1 Tax=Streptomyces sp. NPDC102406 TaxID=3366171 RepID=UPI0037FF7996
MTTAVREAPHHNTLTCYTSYHCRLPECIERYNTNNQARLHANRTGGPRRLTDAQPVRNHVQMLMKAGATGHGIATQAGVSEKVVRQLLPHTKDGRRQPLKRSVLTSNAEKILAVAVEDVAPPSVDATGTVRRIQALVANGWPMIHLAGPLGLSSNYVWELLKRARTEDNLQVASSTARRVTERYEVLSRTRPSRHGIPKRSSTIARRHAAERRWAKPAYWDEYADAIDDPHFQPMYGITRRLVIAEDASFIMRTTGLDRGATAERLGVSRDYIDHAFRDFPEYATEVAA